MNRNLFSAPRWKETMMFLLLVLITIVASFNIVSTLTMIVTEKQREIAYSQERWSHTQRDHAYFMLNGLIIRLFRRGHRRAAWLRVPLVDPNL